MTGMLWVGGEGAIATNGAPRSGKVPFDETCPYPPSTQVFGMLGGVSAIDGAGGLWAQDAEDETGTLFVWTPDQLAQSCASGVPAMTLILGHLWAIAFDSDGNLWGSGGLGVVGYRAADLQATGTLTPTWTLTGHCGPSLDALCLPGGLAFDADNYLWVGDAFVGLLAFSPSTRTGLNDGGFDGTGPLADFHITTPCMAEDYDGGASQCEGAADLSIIDLAFDSAGTLWASTASMGAFHLFAYSRAQLQNAQNNDQPRPVRDLVEPPYALALAFDADGNLWVGAVSDWDAGEPNLLRLPRGSLALDAGSPSDLVAPDISIAVPGSPYWSLAFSPIPSGLPIQP